MNTIDYALLGRAQAEYEKLGYQTIEVPWRVSRPILEVTKPIWAQSDYLIEGTSKGLIASGEQGFLYLMNKGMLPPGKYQTITPCFRNEQYDATHSKQFMKLELINVLGEDNDDEFMMKACVNAILHEANTVMKKFVPEGMEFMHHQQLWENDPTNVPRVDPWDLEAMMPDGKNIELGSYGARRCEFGRWIYGTGLAEPRFTKTMARFRMQSNPT